MVCIDTEHDKSEDFKGVVDYILENGGFVVSNDFDTVDYAVDILEMSISKYSALIND